MTNGYRIGINIQPKHLSEQHRATIYLQIQLPSRGNFEALLTKIYNPDNLVRKSSKKTNNIDREITHKSYAGSSYKDHHKSIKAMTLVAAKKEGLTKDTEIVALSDGAKNCWSVLKSLKKHCKSITYILDWYHIALSLIHI